MAEIMIFGLGKYKCIICKKKTDMGYILFSETKPYRKEEGLGIFICDKCYLDRIELEDE